MESSTSDSIQSSNGGGEEFDSRNDSFSAFLNSSGTSNPPPASGQNHPSPLFDPLSTYFDIFSQPSQPATPNTLLNLDMVLSRGFTSPTSPPVMNPSPSPLQMPPSSGHEHSPSPSPSPRVSHLSNVGVRNPKKRTRASRRAPTTVLTTDTSNFRAMVQEFTGIPPPPFATSPFLGNRLNLFNTSSNMRSVLEPSITYALRPFADKILPPSFLSSMIAASNNGATSNSNTNDPTSTYNFQLPSELGLTRQLQSSTNTQNPMLTLQQSQTSSLPFFNAKSQTSSGMNSALERLGMGHGQLDADQLNKEWVSEEQH